MYAAHFSTETAVECASLPCGRCLCGCGTARWKIRCGGVRIFACRFCHGLKRILILVSDSSVLAGYRVARGQWGSVGFRLCGKCGSWRPCCLRWSQTCYNTAVSEKCAMFDSSKYGSLW